MINAALTEAILHHVLLAEREHVRKLINIMEPTPPEGWYLLRATNQSMTNRVTEHFDEWRVTLRKKHGTPNVATGVGKTMSEAWDNALHQVAIFNANYEKLLKEHR